MFELRCDYTVYVSNIQVTKSTKIKMPWNRQQPFVNTFTFDNLEPYANYTCTINPFYVWYPSILLRENKDYFEHNVKNIDDAKIRAISQKEIDTTTSVYGVGSGKITFQTLSTIPGSPPLDLKATFIGRRAFTVVWTPPSLINNDPNNTFYQIDVEVRNTSSTIFTRLATLNSSDITVSVTDGVKPKTIYKISVKAGNIHGYHPISSDPISIITVDPCPKGTYESGNECIKCDIGFYNDKVDGMCLNCPSTTQTTLTIGSDSLDDCVASVGFLLDANGTVIECPEGAICSLPGVTIETIPLKQGYWRSSNDTLSILSCIHDNYCAGNANTSSDDNSGRLLSSSLSDFTPNQYCVIGHDGVLCESCKDGLKIIDTNQGCRQCTDADIQLEKRSLAILCVFAPLVIIAGGLGLSAATLKIESFIKKQKNKQNVEKDGKKKRKNPITPLWRGINILAQTLQTAGILMAQFSSAYPTTILASTKIASVLALNFSFSLQFPCSYPDITPQHMNILINIVGLVVILALITVSRQFVLFVGRRYDIKVNEINQLFISLWIRILNFIYPAICATLLREFNCTDFGNGLIAITTEVTTLCTTSSYNSWKTFAIVICVVFIPGVPLYFWYKMRSIRDYIKLESEYNMEIEINGSSTITLDTPKRAIAFYNIYHNYKWYMYWTDPLQMIYTVFLSSLLPLFLHISVQSTIAEQMIAVLITLLLLMVFLLISKPYSRQYMNESAVASQALLSCVIFIGILSDADAITGKSVKDRDMFYITSLNVVLWIGCLFIALWPVYYDVIYDDYIDPMMAKYLRGNKSGKIDDKKTKSIGLVLAVDGGNLD